MKIGNYVELVSTDLPTFGRAPTVAVEDLVGFDLAIYGVAWEQSMGVIWDQSMFLRGGARLGPRRIREQSFWFQEVWNPAKTPFVPVSRANAVRVHRPIKVADCGDVNVVPLDREQTTENIRRVSEAIASRAFPLMIGGDHYVMYPAYAGFCAANPEKTIGIIQIDAHNDLDDDEGPWGKYGSATPIRRSIMHARLNPRAVAQLGLRGFTGAAEQAYQHENGIYVALPDDIREHGIAAIVDEARTQVLQHADGIYLTVDIDAVDPSCAPGTTTLVPGGLTSSEFLQLMRQLGQVREVLALDLVEVAPPLDPTDQTTNLAVHALCTFIDEHFLRHATEPAANDRADAG